MNLQRDIYGTSVSALAWSVFFTAVLLASAGICAFLGNWSAAIFFAVLWAGYTNNTSHQLVFNLLKRDQRI